MIEERLAAIEAGLAANAAPARLADGIAELAVPGDAEPALRVRFLLARAAIENRLALPEAALTTLVEARRATADEAATGLRSRVSRLIATIHAWRGRGDAAATELLRALAEASAAGDVAETARALADGGRLAKELGRFEAALVHFDAALASPHLDAPERARALIGRLQSLNDLTRHGDCLAAIEEGAGLLSTANDRLRMLEALEKARATAALGDVAEARAVLADAERFLSDDRSDWDRVEWRQAVLDLDTRIEAEEGGESIRAIIERFAEDGLHLREAAARLTLSEHARAAGDLETAMGEAGAALRIAARERNTRLAERARSQMLSCDAARAASDGEAAKGALLPERYLLCELLGRGGYGVVRRAFDMETGEERAVKTVDLGSVSDPARRRVLVRDAQAEIEAARKIRHPGLVHVHSAFVEDGVIVIVQDLVAGRTLRETQGEAGRPELLDIFTRLAHAMTALHDAGLVHRDLKPDNVMIGADGRPVVIDLGLAALAGVVEDGAVRGTRGYAAPELLKAGAKPAPDPRQDVYALGVMLAEALPPERPAGALRLWRTADPLARLAQAMTSADPAARPASMRLVAAEIERALLSGS